MSERRCHRCGSTLHSEQEGALVFCWHCGAPQVTLSEELQEQAEAIRQAREDEGNAPPAKHSTAAVPGELIWKNAIRLSAIVAGSLAILTVLIPPLVVVVWLWAPLAPAIVLALYAARNRGTRFSAKIGARIGTVCGVLITFAIAMISTIDLLVQRYMFHRMGESDMALNASLAQVKSQLATQSGQQAADVFGKLAAVPEFRAGSMLAGYCFMALVLVILATLGGAFAGSMRARVKA